MEKSAAIKGLKSLKLNDRDADTRDPRKFSEISVEGFDTCSLQKYAFKLTLRKHFASCGKIFAVSVINSVALMRFEGEDAEEKALALNGTDVGGWIPIVKAAPWQREPFDYSAPKIKTQTMFVSGYDTCLPEIDLQIALCNHLSSCGEVIDVSPLPSGRAVITIKGERCEEKALELSGCDVGGMNFVVEPQMNHPASPGKRKKSFCKTSGYTLPSRKLELEERKKKKKEKQKKKKMEEKEKEKEKEKEMVREMRMEMEMVK